MKELDELLKKVEELSDFAHKIKLLTNLEPEEFLDQLTKHGLANEPQKVKVPAFVAGWIELCKEKADASSCLNGYYEIGNGTIVRPRGFSEEFYDWLADCGHMDDLARAWLDGYEVEEERKFEVIFPNLTGEKDLYLMKFYEKLSITSDRNFYVDQRYIFTEKEIKSIDERYWPFAVPVEKVTE